jgi:hypothetical protein
MPMTETEHYHRRMQRVLDHIDHISTAIWGLKR